MNTFISPTTQPGRLMAVLLCCVALFSGCGGGGLGVATYDDGYASGFYDDSEYFLGYDDSFDNDAEGASWYQGDLIPFSEEADYTAGYWDGQFDAYNDGYFVAYRYAFIIGFSEGYDNAYWADYLDFLANDWHVELLHAGFRDGYNDGFSEGRIFGAYDYEESWDFDWLGAFRDWESGTDLYFSEVDKGTGLLGPVTLYEWGQNPHDLVVSAIASRSANVARMRMRSGGSVMSRSEGSLSTIDLAREFTSDQATFLDVSPSNTTRTDRDLTLVSTWRERIEAYQGTVESSAARSVTRQRDGKRAVESQ